VDNSLNNAMTSLISGSNEQRLELVALHGDSVAEAVSSGTVDAERLVAIRSALVDVLSQEVGSGSMRLSAGVLLGRIGDPRLQRPRDAGYWVSMTLKSGDDFAIGRFPVTNDEFKAWVEAGGYDDDANWSDAGRAWRDGCDNPWPVLSSSADSDRLLVGNQPVVGVSWFEAEAYAAAHEARLPRWYERVLAVRGEEKRPYPWGSPFGEGNANTKEEVLDRPCAVGLYLRDRTPDGVCDLAGNVGEWTAERAAGDELLLHPGSWEQPSLAAWAKALTTEAPSARGPGLGFRLVRG
jgi:formylglycine-generating enzyme required for sulfatase activity